MEGGSRGVGLKGLLSEHKIMGSNPNKGHWWY